MKIYDFPSSVGKTFGEITFVKLMKTIDPKHGRTKHTGLFRCSCGKEFVQVRLNAILSGRKTSCGHARIKDYTVEQNFRRYSEKAYEARMARKEANKSNKSTGVKNIVQVKSGYRVILHRGGDHFSRRTGSFDLDEAIALRDDAIRIYEETGSFAEARRRYNNFENETK